jgi:hypothetical protein
MGCYRKSSGPCKVGRVLCVGALLLMGAGRAAGQPSECKLLAGDGKPRDSFGSSLAISGQTALIGAWDSGRDDQGAAYIFTRAGETWTERAKLLASDPGDFDHFGVSCALEGGTALVGAYMKEGSAGPRQGAVYVFERAEQGWRQHAKLVADPPVANSHFGVSLAISGDTAIVGAPGAGECAVNGPPPAGCAYIFKRQGDAWAQQAKLVPAGEPEEDASFGAPVAISGDVAVVGAMGETGGAGPGQGAAYVFRLSHGVWWQEAKLVASDANADDRFGGAVALAGDTAVVSAYFKAGSAEYPEGAAYIFRRTGGTWSEEAKIVGPSPARKGSFGWAVAAQDNIIAVTEPGRAATHVFMRSGATWTLHASLTASDAKTEDSFGSAVALGGDIVLVGACFKDGPADLPKDEPPSGSVPTDAPADPPRLPAGWRQGAVYVFPRRR